jgi:hypothetical protein
MGAQASASIAARGVLARGTLPACTLSRDAPLEEEEEEEKRRRRRRSEGHASSEKPVRRTISNTLATH